MLRRVRSNTSFMALSVVLLLAGCSAEPAKNAQMGPMAALVKVSTASTQTVTDASVFTATAKSRQSVNLSPQISGQISKLLVKAGDVVHKGQPLIEISPEKEQSNLRSQAFATSSNKMELANAKKQFAMYESMKVAKISNLKLAEINRDRYATLSQTGAVSAIDSDQRKNIAEAAKSDLDAIESQIDAQKAVVEKDKQMILQADESTKAQRAELQYHIIRAPFDGMVGEIPVKLGSFVNTSTMLTSVTQNNPLEIHIEVPVEKAHAVKPSTQVEILDEAGTPVGVSQIAFVAPNVSPDSQTVLVKSIYQNPKGVLRADQVVKARVVWQRKQGVTVPTEAVTHQSGEDFIFVADNGKGKEMIARQVAVKLGDIENSRYQVIQGVKPGDKIIVSGVQNLSDKTAISISQ